jgi:hypothetical protein
MKYNALSSAEIQPMIWSYSLTVMVEVTFLLQTDWLSTVHSIITNEM